MNGRFRDSNIFVIYLESVACCWKWIACCCWKWIACCCWKWSLGESNTGQSISLKERVLFKNLPKTYFRVGFGWLLLSAELWTKFLVILCYLLVFNTLLRGFNILCKKSSKEIYHVMAYARNQNFSAFSTHLISPHFLFETPSRVKSKF